MTIFNKIIQESIQAKFHRKFKNLLIAFQLSFYHSDK